MNVSSWGVVGLRVVDHKPEISLEAGPVFVKAAVELGTHSTQVHRVLDNLEVTKWGVSHRWRADVPMTYSGALSRTGSTGWRKSLARLCACSFFRAFLQAPKSYTDIPED